MDRSAFVLSRPHRFVIGEGRLGVFDRPGDAQRALAEGSAPAVVGALPFDLSERCALTIPARFTVQDGRWLPPAAAPPLPAIVGAREQPSAAEHMRRIAALVARIEAGELAKVVAARSVEVECSERIDPQALLAALVARDHAGNGFCADLSPAGPGMADAFLVGSSPESLVRREGRSVSCWPLAGTAPRSPDPVIDAERAEELASSAKNTHEHGFVVEWLRERLAPLCTGLRVEPRPSVVATPQVWHLGTRIEGTLRDPAVSALDLALHVHPTPAVGGAPHEAALAAIRDSEGSRGFYAGAVGWCDARGDGEWMVSIRCAEVRGGRARAFAGGGIVAGSDPRAELEETSAKLRTLLGALGVPSDMLDGV
ncbi:isochorismate synthase [Lolliginicoccus levis]|uniref:isochorismate synthase n=1 Tax=Lolliginicoccus levis TaxID=2919542 RepID=UPI00241E788F|nr:isochorismate synthase [Lolliginicoccus levis]